MKLYVVADRNPGHLPILLYLMASDVAQHDLRAAKQILKQILEDHPVLKQRKLYADKAYIDVA